MDGKPGGDETLERADLDPLTLRFRDRRLESDFRADHFRQSIGNIRFAFLGGIGLWVLWGLVLRTHMLAQADKSLDLVMRLGVFIPLLVLGFALSFTRSFQRSWEWVVSGVAVATILGWLYYSSQVLTLPTEYGYIGLILITAFTYTLLRLRFVLVLAFTGVGIAVYVPYAITAVHIFGVKTVLAILYLGTFGALGGVGAYRMERSARLLFVQSRRLRRERERSDALLLNILPRVIVDRLKQRVDGGHMAEALDEVTVLFADTVDSTKEAARSSPEAFATTLDQLFRRFDAIADRYGLEKIKTIGDSYMAVAGAPLPMSNHVSAAADMALDVLEAAGQVRWPSGEPIVVRLGMATGPAVAGVIGERKFAYDLWGDTVNVASRLEKNAEPGRILVSEALAQRVGDRYEFAAPRMIDLKGKGPTPVRFLVARRSEIPSAAVVTE